VRLVKELQKRPKLARVYIRNGDVELEINNAGPEGRHSSA